MPSIKLSDRERNLAVITLGFVIFYLFYQFLLAPKWDEIKKIREKVMKARIDLRIAEGKIKILETMEKKIKAVPLGIEFQREEGALEVLQALSSATSKSGLNLISIKPVIREKEELKFELSCSGSYKSLYDFFKILREQQILMLVDSLYITGGGAKKPVLNIKMSLTAQ